MAEYEAALPADFMLIQAFDDRSEDAVDYDNFDANTFSTTYQDSTYAIEVGTYIGLEVSLQCDDFIENYAGLQHLTMEQWEFSASFDDYFTLLG